ncbi:MAG: ATP-grasp domain-containing protein [Pseudomonadota bacterium]
MKLYEYEGKTLLAGAGIAVPKGCVAATPAEAVAVAANLGYPVVLKSQVLRGGRGKAGGIRFAAGIDELLREAEALFALSIGSEKVEKLLIEERLISVREIYAGITLDSLTLLPQLLVSAAGGMDIEAAARTMPGKLHRLPLDPLNLPGPPQIAGLLRAAGLQGGDMSGVAGAVGNLIRAYFRYEAVTAEINPLIIDAQGRVIAADAKLEIDDSALGRVKEAASFVRTERSGDPLEAEAKAEDIAYVRMEEGNIGLVSGGAGLGMASMDMIVLHGGAPANFLDLGGNATEEKTAAALRIVLKTPGVEGVLLNLFGGINNCRSMAKGIVQVIDAFHPPQTIVVKMRGHSQDEGWEILEDRGVPLVKFGTTEEAVVLLMAKLKEKGDRGSGHTG